MSELFDASLEFPNIGFTVAVGVVLAYWVFVLLGTLDIDVFGRGDVGGHDVGGDAAGGHDAGGDGHGGDGHDHDHDSDTESGGLWHFLGLGDVPLTISISFIVLTGWVVSMIGSKYVGDTDALRIIMLPIAVVVALLASAVLVRPLRPIFRVREGKTNRDYEGTTCT